MMTYPANIKYDCTLCVYIDPENLNCFFFITLAVAELWASCWGKNGVDSHSPPTCIKFQENNPKASTVTNPGTQVNCSLISEVIAGVMSGMSQSSSQSSSVNGLPSPSLAQVVPASSPASLNYVDPSSMEGIDAFLEFLKFTSAKCLLDMGLSHGVIVSLYCGVPAFNKCLCAMSVPPSWLA
ncbi:hypothetical protein CROQUDRAFT_664699 [Cronartium quercuum f. sp. fusiforme G11]|uniref:Uncharacterized protein n=1 Tax=Cronartium quercuum f. sp. fusiforme G11 TaxID=708437 RepID=A0A9P6NAR6_9BASI|nr:hypothetical protein CROQUDRAFT_664699 [Cronartium quercuum f. sp. fusiforme G11]